MGLVETYAKVKPAIVAFVAKYSHKKGEIFPFILGTGFVIDSNGLILTNRHVVDGFRDLPHPKESTNEFEWVLAILFDVRGNEVLTPPLHVLRTAIIPTPARENEYFDQEPPDIALVGVDVSGLPCCPITLNHESIQEGLEVATAGFPMGRNMLLDTTGGRLKQLSPVLQRGVISAIQPWTVNYPVHFLVNVNVQGGASGSPVFHTETGEILGVIAQRRVEQQPQAVAAGGKQVVDGDGNPLVVWVEHPTSYALAVPTYIIASTLEDARQNMLQAMTGSQTSLEDVYKNRETIDFIKIASGK